MTYRVSWMLRAIWWYNLRTFFFLPCDCAKPVAWVSAEKNCFHGSISNILFVFEFCRCGKPTACTNNQACHQSIRCFRSKQTPMITTNKGRLLHLLLLCTILSEPQISKPFVARLLLQLAAPFASWSFLTSDFSCSSICSVEQEKELPLSNIHMADIQKNLVH